MKIKVIKTIFVCCIVVICCVSCDRARGYSILTIDLTTADRKLAVMSDVFEKVEYIRLETDIGFLVGNIPQLYVTDKYIIVTADMQAAAYKFDRSSGKFVKQIGSKGRGPGEYLNFINTHAFDEKNQIMYFNRLNDWIGIQIETDDVYIVQKPNLGVSAGGFMMRSIQNFFTLDDEFFYSFNVNFTGNDTIMLVIFDNKGKIYKTFPNYQVYEKLRHNFFGGYLWGEYYQFNGNNYFKEPVYNDTIYRITRNAIYPHIVFYLGNKKPEYSLRESPNRRSNDELFIVYLIGESERYVIFNVSIDGERFNAYHDKKTNRTYISENNFINDIDGFLYFSPQFMNNIGEVYFALDAMDVFDFFSNNKDFSENINHLSCINEEDNPVVVIATLKNNHD